MTKVGSARHKAHLESRRKELEERIEWISLARKKMQEAIEYELMLDWKDQAFLSGFTPAGRLTRMDQLVVSLQERLREVS